MLNVGISGAVVLRLVHGAQTASLLATAPRKAAAPDIHLTWHSPPADMAAIQTQPLFYATRRFYVPPDPGTRPAAPPKPAYRLAGTFISPKEPAIAMLSAPTSGSTRRVRAGDMLDGWIVEAVEARKVLLRYEAEGLEITSQGAGSSVDIGSATHGTGQVAGPGGPWIAASKGGSPGGNGITRVAASAVVANPIAAGVPVSVPKILGNPVTATNNGARVPQTAPAVQASPDARLYRPPPR
jgi:hypothetical protein